MGDVTVTIDPDDGTSQLAHSIQVSSDVKLQVSWVSMGAAKVRIDPLGSFDAEGTADLPTEDATYSLVAVSASGAESAPYKLAVHTHEPDDIYSPHAEVSPVPAEWVLDFKIIPDGD
jgi:hypothetical protein